MPSKVGYYDVDFLKEIQPISYLSDSLLQLEIDFPFRAYQNKEDLKILSSSLKQLSNLRDLSISLGNKMLFFYFILDILYLF